MSASLPSEELPRRQSAQDTTLEVRRYMPEQDREWPWETTEQLTTKFARHNSHGSSGPNPEQAISCADREAISKCHAASLEQQAAPHGLGVAGTTCGTAFDCRHNVGGG